MTLLTEIPKNIKNQLPVWKIFKKAGTFYTVYSF